MHPPFLNVILITISNECANEFVQFNIQQHCEEGLVKPKYLQNEITLSELNFEFILKVF